MRSLIHVVTKNGIFGVALILMSLYFAAPSIIPNDTGAFRFGAEYIKENRLDGLAEAVASGAYDTAPQNIKDANSQQLALLNVTQGNDIAASLRAQEEISRIDLELYEAGNLTGDYTTLSASHALLEGLAGLDNPEVYETTADEPMLYRLAELLGTIPPLLLFVPAVAITYAAFRAIEDDRLGFQLPLSQGGKIACAAVTSFVVSVGSFTLSVIPAALISGILNGVGNPNYPVVFIQSGTVLSLTVLATLMRTCALLLAVTLLVVTMSAAVFAISASSVAGCLVNLALGFVPSIPQYFSETFIFHDVLKYLPTTYLYVAPVGGWPNYLNLMDVFPVPGASWELGEIVLLSCSAMFLLISLAFCVLQSKQKPWAKKGGVHA